MGIIESIAAWFNGKKESSEPPQPPEASVQEQTPASPSIELTVTPPAVEESKPVEESTEMTPQLDPTQPPPKTTLGGRARRAGRRKATRRKTKSS